MNNLPSLLRTLGLKVTRDAAEEIERNRAAIAELHDALMALLIAKDEKEYHGDTMVSQSLHRSAWTKARAAITRHTPTTTKEEN